MNKAYLLLALLLLLMLMALFPLDSATYPSLLFSLALLAWLAYSFNYSWLRLRRQAILTLTVHATSGWQVFVNSLLLKAVALILSVTGAFGGLWVVTGLGRVGNLVFIDWGVLISSVFSFMAIYAWLNNKSRVHLKTGFNFVLLWPTFWLNLLVMLLLYVVVFVCFAEIPNYTTQSWSSLFAQAQVGINTEITSLAWLLAFDSATSQYLYGIVQRASLAAADDAQAISFGVQGLFWLALLVWNGLKFALVWSVLLGLVTYIAQVQSDQTVKSATAKGFALGFSLTLASLFAVYFMLNQFNAGGVIQTIMSPLQKVIPALEPACSDARQTVQRDNIQADINVQLTEQQQMIQAELDAEIDRIVTTLFDHPEIKAGVEQFLDWNFSIAGSYVQLFFKGAELVDQAGLEDFIASKFNDTAGLAIERVVNDELSQLDQLFLARATQLVTEIELSANTRQSRCFNLDGFELNVDQLTSGYAGGGGIAAMITARLSARIAAQVGTRMASQLAARVAAKTAAKTAGRTASIGAGAGAAAIALGPCAATGPGVGLCAGAVGIGVGIASWLAVDLAVVRVDELMNRDDMRDFIYATLQAQQTLLTTELKDSYASQLAGLVTEIEQESFRVLELVR
ncbi:hypothetical protein THIAE_05105 [Thiomicrospira aerophila AL3]|uniref:Uncharacterized protein n=1 Tax=Thiomicrospira aerophila AL3 TaxID=717772 RepID=W0DUZ0_9GAMM|nr:hypothetical protein [Thiomicrospira aerophila]AHF02247.1 hypothetical protein THIAE_05105 [Thiomicrospira aerophila AL3]